MPPPIEGVPPKLAGALMRPAPPVSIERPAPDGLKFDCGGGVERGVLTAGAERGVIAGGAVRGASGAGVARGLRGISVLGAGRITRGVFTAPGGIERG